MGGNIRKVERLNNSVYGNPRYRVTFKTLLGAEHIGVTTSNGLASYRDFKEGDYCIIYYHYTPKLHNMRIDDIRRYKDIKDTLPNNPYGLRK